MGTFSVSVILAVSYTVFLQYKKVFYTSEYLFEKLVFSPSCIDVFGKTAEKHPENRCKLQNKEYYGNNRICREQSCYPQNEKNTHQGVVQPVYALTPVEKGAKLVYETHNIPPVRRLYLGQMYFT